MPLAGSDPRMRELSHLHWGKKYYDEGAYDKALAHVGRALHYGVSHNKDQKNDEAPRKKTISVISKPTRREECSVCGNKTGPFIAQYDEKGAKIMCKSCYSEKNEKKKDQCSLSGRADCKGYKGVREYIDRESDGSYKHKLCTNCLRHMKNTTDIQLEAAPVDPDTIKFNELSIQGIDNFYFDDMKSSLGYP